MPGLIAIYPTFPILQLLFTVFELRSMLKKYNLKVTSEWDVLVNVLAPPCTYTLPNKFSSGSSPIRPWYLTFQILTHLLVCTRHQQYLKPTQTPLSFLISSCQILTHGHITRTHLNRVCLLKKKSKFILRTYKSPGINRPLHNQNFRQTLLFNT